MSDDLNRLIDALYAIKHFRHVHGSGTAFHDRAEEIISNLIAGERNLSRGTPTWAGTIARLILEAEANWDQATGKSFCGRMSQPSS